MMNTETLVSSLWSLTDEAEHAHHNIPLAIKTLDSLLHPSLSPLLPLTEVRARLRLSHLLLTHTHNLTHARSHLERAHLLLSRIPSALPLKLRAHSLLSHAYHLTGSIPPQKNILFKALRLLSDSSEEVGHGGRLMDEKDTNLWVANFNAQLASALAVEGDYTGAGTAVRDGMEAAERAGVGELRMFFATSGLHLQLLHWEDSEAVEAAARRCEEIWDFLGPEKVK